MVKVYEITHLLGQRAPFSSKLHHVFTTFLVVIFHGDVFLALVVVYIGFRNTQLFFYTQFYGQSMCVPSSLTMHLESLHRLVAIEGVLDASGQYVVNARMPVCRRRTLVEYELGTTLSFLDTSEKDILLFPF